jgi:hypothetical protein
VRILAIDPGSERSGFVVWDTTTSSPSSFGKLSNQELLEDLRRGPDVDVVVIEKFLSMGRIVGTEVFDAVRWSGRFEEAIERRNTGGPFDAPLPVVYINRSTVRATLCRDATVKDANVRAAILERFGGKTQAIGTKAAPGPLHGMAADVWSALALALTHADRNAA